MSHDNLKELTFRGMFLGALITVIFTASNVYLGGSFAIRSRCFSFNGSTSLRALLVSE